jgi:hypothetical protein
VSSYEIKDLPQVVHQLQIIVLASNIESRHKRRFMGQQMPPDQARVRAMQHNAMPDSPEEARMSEEAYLTAIRIWRAARALGIRWDDNRKMDAEALIMAGL